MILLSFMVIAVLALEAWFENVDQLVLLLPTIVTVLATQLLKLGIPLTDTAKKVLTFVIAVVLCLLAGLVFGWGIFAGLVWWKLVVCGVISGLVSIGLFSLDMVQWLLIILGIGQQKDAYNKNAGKVSRFLPAQKKLHK